MSDNISDTVYVEAFHGTDKKCVPGIINKEFICKKNDEHWLGNGIYLYTDFTLAKWWTTNPTKKFGVEVKDAAIVRCEMQVKKDEYLDLRKLSDYKEFVEVYKEEFLPQLFSGCIKCNGMEGNIVISTKKIRCTFCDFLKERYHLKMIIGNFYLPHQPYLPTEYGELFDRFDIAYIETQICIFNQNIIIKKEAVSL